MENLEPAKGISGTLVGTIVGVNPWKGPLHAYNAIFGLEDEEEREAMAWGTRLEPLIAREYQERTGAILWPHTDFGLDFRRPLRHREIEWWTGTPDRLVITDPKWLIDPDLYYADGEKARAAMEQALADPDFWAQVEKGWEAKTAGWRMLHLWGEEDTDEVPDLYLVQSSWYLGLSRSYNPRIAEWDLSVLLGGQQFRTYQIRHNPRLEEVMFQKAAEFWQAHILARTPPKPSADPAWQEFFQKFYPRETLPLAEATPDEQGLFIELWEARQKLDAWQERYEALSNELKLRLGDREGIQGSFDNLTWKLTWKLTKGRTRTDWEAAFKDLQDRLGPVWQETVDEVVKEHTTASPGVRRFLPSWPKEPKRKKEKAA